MPIFHFECLTCQTHVRLIREPGEAVRCSECGAPMRRALRPPSVHVKEVLDNGVMVKSLERFADAERMFRERAGRGPGE